MKRPPFPSEAIQPHALEFQSRGRGLSRRSPRLPASRAAARDPREDASRPAPVQGRPVRWQRILHHRGWGAGMWPKKFGGAEWTVVQQHLFEEECAAAGAPPQIAFSLRMVAPVLMAFGNAAQQNYFLPRILSGEHWWCQGYSEPDPAPTWPRFEPAPSAAAIITSSTERRPGIRSASTPTGSSARPHPRRSASAARHLLPIDRHEDIGRRAQAHHHPGWRARDQRHLLR